jgi:hypothetical protein
MDTYSLKKYPTAPKKAFASRLAHSRDRVNIRQRLVGYQDAIAGKPVPTGIRAGPLFIRILEIAIASRLTPTRARAKAKAKARSKDRSLRQLLQSPRSPLGRVSARLLLILIHRPRRKAERRDLSGGGSAATVRRSRTQREEVQRSKPETLRPDEFRSEGTPSFSERAERWGKRFFAYFF